MIELFQRARWDQAYHFLESGDPPMILRLLAINTLFLVFYIIRRPRLSTGCATRQCCRFRFLVVANALI